MQSTQQPAVCTSLTKRREATATADSTRLHKSDHIEIHCTIALKLPHRQDRSACHCGIRLPIQRPTVPRRIAVWHWLCAAGTVHQPAGALTLRLRPSVLCRHAGRGGVCTLCCSLQSAPCAPAASVSGGPTVRKLRCLCPHPYPYSLLPTLVGTTALPTVSCPRPG